jgi:hypothetical protein
MSKAIHLANLTKQAAKNLLKTPTPLSLLPTSASQNINSEQQKRLNIF